MNNLSFLKRLFCNHDFKVTYTTRLYDDKKVMVFICKKCGRVELPS